MSTVLWVFVGCLVITAVLNLAWRLGARVFHVPCPVALAWVLESRFMEKRGGTVAVIDRLGLKPGMRVADVGCGPGRLTLPMAARVAPTGDVVALDIQPKMLERIERRIRERNVTNVTPVLGGAGGGKLPAGSFDRAVLVTVLGEIPDRGRALREIRSALKPGGFLSVTEILPDPHYQRLATVRRLAEEAGFRCGDTFSSLLSFTIHLYRPE
jgi:ubiquinone/menaquinone biosynthesis C-methylase UbiE